MATYASATNPFIKPNEDTPDTNDCSAQNENKRQVKKNAPGTARQLSLLDETNKCKQEQVVAESLLFDLPDLDPDHQGPASGPSATTDPKLLDENNNNNSTEKGEELEANPEPDPAEKQSESLQIEIALLERDIDEEIAQTCRSLVERAAVISDKEQGDATEATAGQVAEAPKSPPAATLPRDQLVVLATNKQQDDEDEEEDKTTLEGDEAATPRRELELTRDANGTQRRHQHIELIKKLRLQLKDLERYAHERGELERMPASVLLERQTVILDTLRKKLPHFSILADKDKLEKLELDELKRQADDEINNLIDPLITKEHLLNQLRTQLTDLEKYVSHLHGTIGITNGSCCPTTDAVKLTNQQQTTNCLCALHGCSQATASLASSASSPSTSRSRSSSRSSSAAAAVDNRQGNILSSDTLPKTSRLIRGLMAQLICSDIKIQEAMKLEKDFNKLHLNGNHQQTTASASTTELSHANGTAAAKNVITTKPMQAQFHDGAAWTLHIDRVTLATDSLTNIYTLAQESEPKEATAAAASAIAPAKRPTHVDNSLVDSVVRRQLVPAMRDLLAYGLIDPSSLPPRSSYVSFFDPYYLLSSLTCLPGTGTQAASGAGTANSTSAPLDKVHVWHVIADYFDTRNEPTFRNSSVKTLSQSFNLTSTMDGPIKITSKQALLIAVDDIIERLARCKPNGPESHFKLFVYTALNQGKLATWIRIIFKNKAIMRKYYHNFSFVCQVDKMDRFLSVIDALGKFDFKLNTDTEAMDQFVSAF